MDGDGELRLSIMATMAQEESRKISERVLAGQKISRQNGVLYGSGNIIGYDRDKVNRTYVINEEQAATIRMVFTLYSQGYGEKAIVNELSRLGRKDGHGNVSWSCTKISRILRNATYMGYRKSPFLPSPSTLKPPSVTGKPTRCPTSSAVQRGPT